MKLTQMLAGTALFATLITSTAYAGDRGGRCLMDKDAPDFSDIDIDGSGGVSLEEFKAKGEARFAMLDGDGNGEISLEEFQEKAAERHGGNTRRSGMTEVIFKGLDGDNSGGVSIDEASAMIGDIEARFAKLDKDESGELSEDEMNRWGVARRHGGRHGHSDKECQGGQGQ